MKDNARTPTNDDATDTTQALVPAPAPKKTQQQLNPPNDTTSLPKLAEKLSRQYIGGSK